MFATSTTKRITMQIGISVGELVCLVNGFVLPRNFSCITAEIRRESISYVPCFRTVPSSLTSNGSQCYSFTGRKCRPSAFAGLQITLTCKLCSSNVALTI